MGQKINRAYFVLPAKQVKSMAERGDEAAKEEWERRVRRRKRKKKGKKL